jgi:hypothetical protein
MFTRADNGEEEYRGHKQISCPEATPDTGQEDSSSKQRVYEDGAEGSGANHWHPQAPNPAWNGGTAVSLNSRFK